MIRIKISSDKTNDILPEIIKEVLDDEKNDSYKINNRYIIVIISSLMIILLILMIIPYWQLSRFTYPKSIPSIDEINVSFLHYNKSQKHGIDEASLLTYPTPEIRTISEEILSRSCKEGTDGCYAQALYYFVRNNIKYISDPLPYEYIKEPSSTLITSMGDCDDHAVLLASMMRSIGVPTQLVLLPRHMIIKIYLEDAPLWFKKKDGWIYLDPTCKNCGFGKIDKKWEKYIKT